MKIKKPKHLTERKGVRGGYTTTVQDIVPHLPNEDCFFDCRHFVYAPTSEALPFSLTTRTNANNQQYLKIRQATKQGYAEVQEGGVFDAAYPESTTRRGRVQEGGRIAPTLCTSNELNVFEGMENKDYRIRKLTPRECFRLMGVSEENIDKIQAAGISNSQQYKMAGNSIVVDCLYHIFKKMFIEKENDNEQLTLF